MFGNTFSALLPFDKKVPYYEAFVLQYSLIMSSNLIIFDLIKQSDDSTIHNYFEQYHKSFNEYKNNEEHLLLMGIEARFPQTYESRGFVVDRYFTAVSCDKRKPKDCLLSLLNMKEFLLLYASFEECLKNEFRRVNVLRTNQFMKEKDIFKLLEKKLRDKGFFDSFCTEISKRSVLPSYGDVIAMWDFFTHFRHLCSHACGIVTTEWMARYEPKLEKIVPVFSPIDPTGFIDSIEVNEGKMIYISDQFVGLFRNYILWVMESLYIVDDEYA